MRAVRPTVALLAFGFVVASAGGCSCVRILGHDYVERALLGPAPESAVLGAEVAWAGEFQGANDGGSWDFTYMECPAEARKPLEYRDRTAFVDPGLIRRTSRRFAVRWKGKDVHDLPERSSAPRVGWTYVVYGRVTEVDPVPTIEIDGSLHLVELRVSPRMPDLFAFDPVLGYWDCRRVAQTAHKPCVVFLPESIEASQSEIARYLAEALDAETRDRVVLGVDDSPRTWSRFRTIFHRDSPGPDVPFVVVDAKGSRCAEIPDLRDPRVLRAAVSRVLK